MLSILQLFLGIFFLSTSLITHTVAVGQSTAPTQCFMQVCPSEDKENYALGEAAEYHVYTSNNIFCSYPTHEGDDPQGYYCDYSPTTGQLTTAHDASGCPTIASTMPITCSKKRALERSMYDTEAKMVKERAITVDTRERQEKRRGMRRHGVVA